MPASPSIFLKALGLRTQQNRLELQPGSLIEASNVIIRNESIVEPRRGFKLYGTTFGATSDRLKQLMEYRGALIRHYNDQLQFDTSIPDNTSGLSNFNTFAGSYTEVETGLRIKSIESNGNFYFTTNDGIKKIAATSSSDFSTSSGYITDAGGVKALDVQAMLKITPGDQTDFFTQDSVVAYRILWNLNDVNKNQIQGTPSSREEIYNPMLNLMLGDFSILLDRLDKLDQTGGGLIDDNDYISTLNLPNTSSAASLRTNLITLATKLDLEKKYAGTSAVTTTISTQRTTTNALTIVFAANLSTYLSAGDKVILSGFTTADLNGKILTVTGAPTATVTFSLDTGSFTATDGAPVADVTGTVYSYDYRNITQPLTPVNTIATHDELLSIQNYLQNIITRLRLELSGVISTSLIAAYIDTIVLTKASTVILNISVPPTATTNHFYQVYRTAVKSAIGTDLISDLDAGDEEQLIFEDFPTQAQIDSGIVTIEDDVLDSFRGAFLYTNAISGEGILQANDVPPLAKDINKFKTTVFYANTQTRNRLSLALLGVQDLVTEHDAGRIPKLVISSDNGYESHTYEFRKGVKEVTPITCTVAAGLAGKYFTINSANDFNKYYVWYEINTVGADPAVTGKTGIKVTIDTATMGGTATDVARETRDTLNSFIRDFTCIAVGSLLTITNIDVGETTNATIGTSGFAIGAITQGSGEKATQEETQLVCGAGSAAGLAGSYFTLNSAYDRYRFYFWYTVNGAGTDPLVSNRTGVVINVLSTDTSTQIATKTKIILDQYITRFTTTQSTNTLTITNVKFGWATNSTFPAPPVGFSISTLQNGDLIVLLSDSISPGIAVDSTAKSLVRIINRTHSEIISAFYTSSPDTTPGQMDLEAKSLATQSFYLLMNKDAAATVQVGDSFQPSLTPTNLITNISAANPTVLTSTGHGLTNGDEVLLSNTSDQTAAIPNFDGVYTVSNVTSTTFTVPVQVTLGAARGSFTKLKDFLHITISDNEVSPNRLYYSKVQQPEAVPILNFIDVGPKEKQILRIVPMRDSLMIFKEEGIYRLSGEIAPFSVSLLDITCHLQAPDSIGLVENLIFFWSNNGIEYATESGVINIGRPIDIDLLAKNTPQYTNFKSATWGVGYEDDNTYLVWTVKQTTDTIATICYVYHVLTNSWTTYDKTNTCGIISTTQRKLFLGAGDTDSIEAERKNFSRTDYADREISKQLLFGNYASNGQKIVLADITNIKNGDVLIQEQLVSVYDFNALLQKLSIDPGLLFGTDYYDILKSSGGDDLRDKIANSSSSIGLAAKLDSDPNIGSTDYHATVDAKSGSIIDTNVGNPVVVHSTGHGLVNNRIVQINGSNTSPSIDGTYVISVVDADHFSIPVNVTTAGGAFGSWATINSDFRDIKACFNAIVNKLNADSGASFSNYQLLTNTTTQEAVITDVNLSNKTITLNISLPYVVGPLTIYQSIISTFTYSPLTAGDPMRLKQIHTAHMFFQNQTFTSATLSFASDLLPKFNDILFNGQGNGSFGNKDFGTGQFFGGQGNSQPFRTYIPRDAQRCTFMSVKFTHRIARERYATQGVSLYGNFGESERTFR